MVFVCYFFGRMIFVRWKCFINYIENEKRKRINNNNKNVPHPLTERIVVELSSTKLKWRASQQWRHFYHHFNRIFHRFSFSFSVHSFDHLIHILFDDLSLENKKVGKNLFEWKEKEISSKQMMESITLSYKNWRSIFRLYDLSFFCVGEWKINAKYGWSKTMLWFRWYGTAMECWFQMITTVSFT